ncbi:MAG: family peptidase [Leifsonia sp.]|nr:family peptidase [Leifsonia sp.]
MKATDLGLLNAVSSPTVHPDASRAVVSVTRPDHASDSYVGQLWSVPLAGQGAPRRITRGFRDVAPQFSPDGRLIAFRRSSQDGSAQLYVVDAAGGEPVQVTDVTLGVTDFTWSPDGRQLAFVTRVPEQGRYGTVNGIEPNAEPVRRITTLKYQANGLGYINDRRAQIFLATVPDVWDEPIVQPAPTAEGAGDPIPLVSDPHQVTHGDYDNGSPSFSPDGHTLAFLSARHPDRDGDLRSSVLLLDLEQGDVEPVDVTGEYGNWSMLDVAYSLNGSLFFLAQEVGESGRDFVARNTALYVIDRRGVAPRRLTDVETIDLGESSITTIDDDTAFVQDRTRGTLQLLGVGADGTVTRLTDGDIEVTGVGVAGSTVAISYADAATHGDVAILEDGILRRLTDFSAPLRASGLAASHELLVRGRDGYDVHGWVVLPRGGGPHPVLLTIHGGPFAQSSVRVFDEAQVYADAGYAVVMCNPRGSAGYGQAHGRAIRRVMGTLDLQDVLDFLDSAISRFPELDGDRVGIMGGSYGGYLTAWATAHDHRFAAAIVERGYLDPEAFVGPSDIGSFFSDEYTGTDPERIRAQSPQAHVGLVRTPTLVMHSSNDLRCPLGQAERYYAALKRGGVETELFVFPGEDHELSRSGRPRHRQQRFEAILDWWSMHLPSAANHG